MKNNNSKQEEVSNKEVNMKGNTQNEQSRDR